MSCVPVKRIQISLLSVKHCMQGHARGAPGQLGHAATANAVIAEQLLELANVTKVLHDLSMQMTDLPD